MVVVIHTYNLSTWEVKEDKELVSKPLGKYEINTKVLFAWEMYVKGTERLVGIVLSLVCTRQQREYLIGRTNHISY